MEGFQLGRSFPPASQEHGYGFAGDGGSAAQEDFFAQQQQQQLEVGSDQQFSSGVDLSSSPLIFDALQNYQLQLERQLSLQRQRQQQQEQQKQHEHQQQQLSATAHPIISPVLSRNSALQGRDARPRASSLGSSRALPKADRPKRPKVVEEKGGVQCIGRNRKKNTQCRNAALMEYIGPRPAYCAEHIEADPNSLYMKCGSAYQIVPGDDKRCKEVVLKEFGVCYKHFRDLCETLDFEHCRQSALPAPARAPLIGEIQVSQLRALGGSGVPAAPGNEPAQVRVTCVPDADTGLEKAASVFGRVVALLDQLIGEAHAAKRDNSDLYQRKNKLIPKFQEMRRHLAALLDKYGRLGEEDARRLLQERSSAKRQRRTAKSAPGKLSALSKAVGAGGNLLAATGAAISKKRSSPSSRQKSSKKGVQSTRRRRATSAASLEPPASNDDVSANFTQTLAHRALSNSASFERLPGYPPSSERLSDAGSQRSHPLVFSGRNSIDSGDIDHEYESLPSSPLALMNALEIGSDGSSVVSADSPFSAGIPTPPTRRPRRSPRERLRERSASTPAIFRLAPSGLAGGPSSFQHVPRLGELAEESFEEGELAEESFEADQGEYSGRIAEQTFVGAPPSPQIRTSFGSPQLTTSEDSLQHHSAHDDWSGELQRWGQHEPYFGSNDVPGFQSNLNELMPEEEVVDISTTDLDALLKSDSEDDAGGMGD